MNDKELAKEIIERLNKLISDDESGEVRSIMHKLCENRFKVSDSLGFNHPTIQVDAEEGTVGFLGILNGLVGTIPDGNKKGWGYIAGSFDSETKEFLRFVLTLDDSVKPA